MSGQGLREASFISNSEMLCMGHLGLNAASSNKDLLIRSYRCPSREYSV